VKKEKLKVVFIFYFLRRVATRWGSGQRNCRETYLQTGFR